MSADEDGRRALLRELVEVKYADALALSANATSGQLAEVFRARKLSGATVDKAISFYLGIADYVGLTVSPHFKKGRSAASTNGSAKRRRVTKTATTPPPVVHAPVVKATTTAEQQRSQYVEMLMGLAKDADRDVQTDLLDRIERALGYNAPSSAAAPEGEGA